VLEARTRTLGAQHDTTMSVAAILAEMCSAQGKLAEAGELQAGLLEASAAKWGAEHPLTREFAATLAATCTGQGQHARAAGLRALYSVGQDTAAGL